MIFYRVHRRMAAWLAMLALVMSALAPTIAHAWVAAADESQWIEVCSASGMVWLKAEGSDSTAQGASEPGAPMADMGKHCPWCSFHGSMVGLPPAVGMVNVVSANGPLLPASLEVDLPGQVQRGPQARAPPIAS